jgi:hypothetical protein
MHISKIASLVLAVMLYAQSVVYASTYHAQLAQRELSVFNVVEHVNKKMNEKFNQMSEKRQKRLVKRVYNSLDRLQKRITKMDEKRFARKHKRIQRRVKNILRNNIYVDDNYEMTPEDYEVMEDLKKMTGGIETGDMVNHAQAFGVDPNNLKLKKDVMIAQIRNAKADLYEFMNPRRRGDGEMNPRLKKILNWVLPLALIGVLTATGQIINFLVLAAFGTAVFFALVGIIELTRYIIRRHRRTPPRPRRY